jgi:hypothetical protein
LEQQLFWHREKQKEKRRLFKVTILKQIILEKPFQKCNSLTPTPQKIAKKPQGSLLCTFYYRTIINYYQSFHFHFFFQSSLDRGCFSCECLIVPDSREGIRFWKRKLGTKKIEDILEEKKRKKEEEVILEISRAEMKILLDQQDDEESDMEQQH